MIICYVYKCVLLLDFMPLCFLYVLSIFVVSIPRLQKPGVEMAEHETRSEWMYFLQTLRFRISQDALDLLFQAKHWRVPVASRDESATLKVV